MNINKTEKYNFNDLVEIMDRLRSPEGCPWDIKQTHMSLRQYLIEEVYELIDEIDMGRMEKVCDELGDLLLQIIFHAKIAEENGCFDINDVTDAICRKMISRHTHVFGDAIADTPDEVLVNWDKIKKDEKGQTLHSQSLADVPKSLPALSKSMKVQQKAARIGFDWDNIDLVFSKMEEELSEIKEAISESDSRKIEDEVGDMLFSAVNIARFLNVHPEIALNKATRKFVSRFKVVEQRVLSNSLKLEDMRSEELDKLWDEAKVFLENG